MQLNLSYSQILQNNDDDDEWSATFDSNVT